MSTIDTVMDLDAAAVAHERMASNVGFGKIILRPCLPELSTVAELAKNVHTRAGSAGLGPSLRPLTAVSR
jgi:hypothetical protein